jgi:hypothetical protein
MSPLRIVFLGLAILGAIVPMFYFVSWFQANGWSLGAMVTAWHANDATSGLVWDLTIAAVTLTVWILAEAISRKDWASLVAVAATFLIGVSCGLPLYLFLRSRPRGA